MKRGNLSKNDVLREKSSGEWLKVLDRCDLVFETSETLSAHGLRVQMYMKIPETTRNRKKRKQIINKLSKRFDN